VIPGASPISARVFIPYFDHPVFTTSVANINEFINGGRDLITVTLINKPRTPGWINFLPKQFLRMYRTNTELFNMQNPVIPLPIYQ
jgi:hypothetical protein